MGDETIRSHLHGFLGEIWPRGVKKCAKTYVKKPKMRANAHERYLAGQKMNADGGVIGGLENPPHCRAGAAMRSFVNGYNLFFYFFTWTYLSCD